MRCSPSEKKFRGNLHKTPTPLRVLLKSSRLEKLSDINTGRSLTQIVEKLPWDLRKGWLKRVHHIKTVESKVPTIDDVVKFVAASAEQANDPVFGKLVSRDDTSKSRKNAKQQPQPRAKQRSTFSV